MKNKEGVFSQEKIHLHGDRVREYLTAGRTKAPVTLELDLTNKCNNRCPGCTGYNEDNIGMDYDAASQIVHDASQMGVRGLIFTGGGEPVLHQQLVPLMQQAKYEGMSVGLITSGQVASSSIDLEGIIRSASWVRISADAGSSEVYLKTHGLNQAKYERMWAFTKSLVDEKRAIDVDCTVGMGYLTGDSKTSALGERLDLERFARRAATVGVDYAQLRPFHNSERPARFEAGIRQELKNFDTALLASNHKYELMKQHGGGNRDYDYCHGAHFASVVTANGDLTVCCHLRNQELGKVSNVHELGLKQAWDDSLHSRTVAEIDVHKCLPYCRADGFNRALEGMVKDYGHGHKNFL